MDPNVIFSNPFRNFSTVYQNTNIWQIIWAKPGGYRSYSTHTAWRKVNILILLNYTTFWGKWRKEKVELSSSRKELTVPLSLRKFSSICMICIWEEPLSSLGENIRYPALFLKRIWKRVTISSSPPRGQCHPCQWTFNKLGSWYSAVGFNAL
jgi:hypothetical protein